MPRYALILCSLVLLVFPAFAQVLPPAAQPLPGRVREFSVGSLSRLDELPASRLRTEIERLPPLARQRALQWLQSFHFHSDDLPALRTDANGGIFYVCAAATLPAAAELPPVGEAAVPISPFPSHLIFHSKPGAPNVLYLNFGGELVSNSQWNTVVDRTEIPAVAFSTDSDYATFSDSEQAAIKRIWQRMAEDFASFNIDVTTERPGTFNNRTAHALITRNTDANGDPNPYSTAGGVAYVNVFNTVSYANYRPAWIYNNNLADNESYIAEAASHEIGHNLGLSHDGTSSDEYYGGHGSGDTSWGPLMGTGYNRNVSQWSKGDYYQANNTQDDLATIAGKISYRTDDHGNTTGTATALTLTGTNIVSTTPENDPANNNPANKGVLESSVDVDVFSLVTGSGAVSLNVNPWIMPSGTRGGNLDVSLELYDADGNLLLTNNPAAQTIAQIQTNLAGGTYYLRVRNSAAGDPLASTPTGYTAYGSIGQYYISGYVAPLAVVPPVAQLQISDITQAGQGTKQFTVTYSDNVAVDVSTIDSSDIRVTGPNGYDVAAQFDSVDVSSDGTPRVATYSVEPPSSGIWSSSDDGTYTVWMQTNQVGDSEGVWVAGGELGQFNVTVPVVIYTAYMDTDPSWMLEPQWQFGTPAYSSGGPTSGYTGTNIVAYNLSGNYANNLAMKYATTPEINCAGTTQLTLKFRRWLGLRGSDTAVIEVSTNGTSWLNVWSTSSAVTDTSWQEVQYTLPPEVAGSSTLQLRWGIASNPVQTDIGWNLDDVELLGDATPLDITPPVPSLTVTNITSGSASHFFTVTYTDDTAVRLASLDSLDVQVTGPNGYSDLAAFVVANLPDDGTPVTATYSIPAAGGWWDAAANGTYSLVLMDSQVEDIYTNATPQTALGSFNVSISAGQLAVTPADNFIASGTVGGPFSPTSIIYTMTNSGGSALNWTASKTANWVSLSATSGSLAAGASTTVTVSLNSAADNLTAGSYIDTVSFLNTTTGNGDTSRNVNLMVNSAGQLAVTPASDLNVSGTEGGPFTPTSIIYTLTNSGGSALDWSASQSTAWLTLSATSGTLAPGASTNVTVSINAEANALTPGNYSDTVSFLNTSTGIGDATRAVNLTVNSFGQLTVSPAADLNASGTEGGPFNPSLTIYTLTNSGGSTLNWTASKTANWVNLSATTGNLAAGASTTVTVSLNSAADSLAADSYSDTVSFINTTTGVGDTTRSVNLTVNSPSQLALSPVANLNASGTEGGPFNPSSTIYTLTNSGGSALDWSASQSTAWVTLSAASGSLAPGASTNLTVSINAEANTLPAGNYSEVLGFTNLSTGLGDTTRSVNLTVNSPGQLTVGPAADLNAGGTVGGPFTPVSITYTLTNSGGSSLDWTADKSQNWVSLSATSGTLAAGGSTTVTVSINANGDALSAGSYSDIVSFLNTTTSIGDTSRSVNLTVNSAGQLAVSPADDFIASGTVGGPFSPTSISYTLTNSGGSTLNWTASKTANWVSLSATSGSLAAGDWTNVTVLINTNADGLAADSYDDMVSFVNTTTVQGDTTRPVNLIVNSLGQLAVSPAAALNAGGTEGGPFSPNSILYTLTNSGGSALDWFASQSTVWVTLSAAAGTLAPGESTSVTVSINTEADSLTPGNYSDTVSFLNTTTGDGDTSRSVNLTVNSLGQLAVGPAAALNANGTEGGPFTPTSTIYTLTNSGGSALDWSASQSAAWVTLSAASGNLAPGESTNVTASINTEADALTPGNYSDTVSFLNTTTGNGDSSRSVNLAISSAGQLVVSPADNFNVSGAAGGPFSPTSHIYTLTNSGGSALDWTATKSADWLTLSANGGTLETGASTNVIVALNTTAEELSPGEYLDTVSFQNATAQSRPTAEPIRLDRSVNLTIHPVGRLTVLPASDVEVVGPAGGPFTPDNHIYTLTNTGGSTLDWTITATAGWLNLSATTGRLDPGANTNVIVSLHPDANTLPAGSYSDVLGFTNVTTGTGDTARLVTLTVNALVGLTVTVNNPEWGSVSPTNGTYVAGSSLELLASPAAYFRFISWSGDGSGTENPLSLLLDTNKSVLAAFGEILTTNHPTPHWWLATHGYTNDLETAVASLGVNGVPLWQSYIAGLDPNNPASQFRLAGHLTSDGRGYVLAWNTVTNRVYTIWVNTNLSDGFTPLPGASNLPWTIQSFTNDSFNQSSLQFYRIEVRKP